ncbi:MAG: NAD-dependent deacylase [Opitutaceae bacterium]|jgi:NAD-dependent deacetylase|nr:NAD-dependent deacylase [Opitutaceae bacterium]
MKKLIVLTGAGMSAESGIATFRDSGGLWEKHRVEDVATPRAWRENRALVLDFYNQRRRQLISAKPNAGHALLSGLQKDFDVRIITQNVDDLHERAGSRQVLHLHGELMKARSSGPDQTVFDIDPQNPDIRPGDKSPLGCQLRPHVVWFGEDVPNIREAARLVSQADILLIIGTSLKVFPAAGLVDRAPLQAPVYLIDPGEIPPLPTFLHFIQETAANGLRIFIENYLYPKERS